MGSKLGIDFGCDLVKHHLEVIDSLIQNELGYYKERFRQDGISGILGDL
jgi:hypothetical protein